MRKELSRIEPRSVVKISFFLGFGLCFLIGLFYGFFLKGTAGTTDSLFPNGETPFGELTWGGVWLSAFLIALAGSVFYAIIGGVIAVLYNFVARLFGGIEIQVTDEPAELSGETQRQGRES